MAEVGGEGGVIALREVHDAAEGVGDDDDGETVEGGAASCAELMGEGHGIDALGERHSGFGGSGAYEGVGLSRLQGDDGASPLLELVVQRGQQAAGMGGGLVALAEDGDEVVAATGVGQQRVGIVVADDGDLLVGLTHDEGYDDHAVAEHVGAYARLRETDTDELHVGEHGTGGHARAGGEEVVAGIDGIGTAQQRGPRGKGARLGGLAFLEVIEMADTVVQRTEREVGVVNGIGKEWLGIVLCSEIAGGQ